MVTLKAKYKNGKVIFCEPLNEIPDQDVLVTFLSSNDEVSNGLRNNVREIRNLVYETGLVLSRKELSVLRQAQSGAKVEDIAEVLEITHGSARNHLSSIYSKLKVRNRTEAIKKAVRLGLLEPYETIFD
ncbi:MAG: LuxR C-terminal-related transcriptional regulator [Anaerolineaceae bacterium]|nr:LuxR C-terminal-related transcriptional regulator [Anaerolineaceae bacterium]